jgi:hypothetical protein
MEDNFHCQAIYDLLGSNSSLIVMGHSPLLHQIFIFSPFLMLPLAGDILNP